MAHDPALPTFEQIRREARTCLSDARDRLKSRCDEEITSEQGASRAEALLLIGQAKAALDRAAP